MLTHRTTQDEASELSLSPRMNAAAETAHAARSAADLTAAFMREKRKRKRAFWWLCGTTQVLILANCLLTTFLIGKIPFDILPILMIGGSAAAFAPMFFAPSLLFLKPSRKQRVILDALSSLEEVNAIPSLWESLSFTDKRLAGTATEKLIDLLPCVQAEHVGMFTDQQLKGMSAFPLHSLTSVRKRLYDEDLAIACLRAVTAVGDERNMEDVRKATVYDALTDRDRRIRDEAIRCRAVLEVRVAGQRPAGTLLRPVESATAAQNLLRPAASGQPEESNLLRSSNPDPTES